MRAALSIVLAGLLVMARPQPVLAQTAQQEAVSLQQAVPPDGAAHLFHVPPLKQNTARPLRASSDHTPLEPPASNPASPAWPSD